MFILQPLGVGAAIEQRAKSDLQRAVVPGEVRSWRSGGEALGRRRDACLALPARIWATKWRSWEEPGRDTWAATRHSPRWAGEDLGGQVEESRRRSICNGQYRCVMYRFAILKFLGIAVPVRTGVNVSSCSFFQLVGKSFKIFFFGTEGVFPRGTKSRVIDGWCSSHSWSTFSSFHFNFLCLYGHSSENLRHITMNDARTNSDKFIVIG